MKKTPVKTVTALALSLVAHFAGLMKLLSLLVILAMLVVGSVSTSAAETPKAFLERSEVFGIGNRLHVLRVPTQNINGRIKYYDLVITLSVNDNGVILSGANVSRVISPTFLTNEFIPGTYDDGEGGTCTLGVSAASGGRVAGSLACRNGNGFATLSANWVTGPIAGHPFETELVAAGIDQNTGAANVAWGQGSGNYEYGGCFYAGNIIAVHQAGNVLAINNFGSDTRIDCNYSFTLVQQ